MYSIFFWNSSKLFVLLIKQIFSFDFIIPIEDFKATTLAVHHRPIRLENVFFFPNAVEKATLPF